MKRLENDEIERQLKCKIVTWDCAFRVRQGVPYKGEIQLHEAGWGGGGG
jgi:hypothetical protein